MIRCFLFIVSDSRMGRNCFEEDELLWRRRRVGLAFLSAVSIMLMRPWSVSRVNDGMVMFRWRVVLVVVVGVCIYLRRKGLCPH